ncbi:DUF5908 family protein [Paraburkholderia sp. RL17-337-BIB-A]|uniref:DUF5908 family protein n=1 Tax=Paraburkholderia sp. RL17-337-BIB-A TaxID=3031636 RepID=UPI0038B88464
MPIEIKELHIRVTVAGLPPGTSANAGHGGAHDASHDAQGAAKDELVAECVEQVLHILQAKKER